MPRGMGWSERGAARRPCSLWTPAGSGDASGRPAERVAGVPVLRVVSAEYYPDWEAVYRDNLDRVYRLMFAKVGNRSDAEDLTAEVFLAALRRCVSRRRWARCGPT